MHWLVKGQANRRKPPVLPGVVEKWTEREILDPDTFRALSDELKAKSFTVTGGEWQGLLSEVHASLTRALAEGRTQGEWARDVWPKIAEKHGGGSTKLSAHVGTIFRTNTQAAYAGGRYAIMFRPDRVERIPFVQYLAVADDRTRLAHRALHRKVFAKQDWAARRYYPPLGFGCRCRLRELTEKEVRAGGWDVTPGHELGLSSEIGPPPAGWDTDRVTSLVDDTLKKRLWGPPDAELTERIVQRHEEELRKITTHEEGVLFDRYGLVLWKGRSPGDDPSILYLPDEYRSLADGAIFTHNHRGGGPLTTWFGAAGTRPERGDLLDFQRFSLHQVRAVAERDGSALRWVAERPSDGLSWTSEDLQNATELELSVLSESEWWKTRKAGVTSYSEKRAAGLAFYDELLRRVARRLTVKLME